MSTNKQPEISLSGMPLPTLLLDTQQHLISASPSFVTVFGDPAEHVGAPLDALFDPRDRRGTRSFHRAMSRHREGALVAELKMKITRSQPARLHMVEIDNGWLVSVISTIQEQAATESLQQARSGLRAILSCMSDGLLVLNIDGAVQDCNQAALSFFRFTSAHGVLLSSEAIMGRTLPELFDADVASRLAELVTAVSDDPDRAERLHIKRADRSLVVSLNPIFVPRKGYQGVCITARDLTELESLHSRLSEEMSLVRERTVALHERNSDMRRVLDNVQQGLLTVDMQGVISPERSSVFDQWVGRCPEGTTLFEAITPLNPDAAMMLEMGWDQLSWGMLPVELCLEQLPSSFMSSDRHFSLSYEPIFASGEELERVLVMMTDTTEVIRRETAEELQKESVKAFESINKDRAGFLAFHQDAMRIIALIRGSAPVAPAVFAREVHTLKGNSGMMGLSGMVERCHELENRMDAGELTDADRMLVPEWWDALNDNIESFIQDSGEVILDPEDFRSLEEDIERCTPYPALLRRVRSLRLESVQSRLGRLVRQVDGLAERLGKGPVQIIVQAGGMRLCGDKWGEFYASLVHVVRNSVDHGLETPQRRQEAGKSAPASLWLRAQEQDDTLVFEIEDNGSGIDWSAIRSKAAGAGLASDTHQDLQDALFSDGISSRDEVSTTSGRGVGMAAVAAVVSSLGGQIDVDSRPGEGTLFRFVFPRKQQQAA